jgi:hypothetical protein
MRSAATIARINVTHLFGPGHPGSTQEHSHRDLHRERPDGTSSDRDGRVVRCRRARRIAGRTAAPRGARGTCTRVEHPGAGIG